MENCLFCKIISGEIPCRKIYEDQDTFAFLDIKPLNPGHTLVIPKKHSEDIFSIDETSWLAVTKTVRVIAGALERALMFDGVNICMNNRAHAGQVVFHAHVHVIPRIENDGHKFPHGKSYEDGETEKIREKIVAELKNSYT